MLSQIKPQAPGVLEQGLLSQPSGLYLKPASVEQRQPIPVKSLNLPRTRARVGAWLRIAHCNILCAFTMPWVITPVLRLAFRRGRGDSRF